MYYTWRKLTKVNQDQLNIKSELKYSTVTWVGFSVVYFSVNLITQSKKDDPSFTDIARYVIFFGIVARNLFTFYATTLFTLYSLTYKDQTDYNLDARFNTKLNILNLDVIMTHKMPYSSFKEFISEHA